MRTISAPIGPNRIRTSPARACLHTSRMVSASTLTRGDVRSMTGHRRCAARPTAGESPPGWTSTRPIFSTSRDDWISAYGIADASCSKDPNPMRQDLTAAEYPRGPAAGRRRMPPAPSPNVAALTPAGISPPVSCLSPLFSYICATHRWQFGIGRAISTTQHF